MLREYMDVAGHAPASVDDASHVAPRAPAALSLVVPAAQPGRVGLLPSANASTLLAAIERLERTVELETAELRGNRVVDLRDFNQRKSQGLLELTRLTRGLGPGALDGEAKAALARLRGKLDANLALLRLHLAAAQEVATLISRVIRDAESDGTYSSFHGRS
jgi:hypothetical protein